MSLARLALALTAFALGGAALAKLPAPNEEAKAKAAEAAAKTAWSNKVADFQLCKSQDRTAATYQAALKRAGKEAKVQPTPPCADPGPFVYAPPASAPALVAPAAAKKS